MIHWHQLSWEAFATFSTGILAVGGAIFIGLKQTKLQHAQMQILETQVRIALFEERKACVDIMRRVYSQWMQNSTLSDEEWTEFRDVFQKSELLFSKSLSVEIEETITSTFWQRRHLARSHDLHQRGNEEDSIVYMRKSFEEDDKVFKLMPRLLEKMKHEARVSDWIDTAL